MRDATCPGTSAQSQVRSQALCSSLGASSFPGCVCLPLPPSLTPVRHRPSPGGRGGNQHPFNGLCRAHVYLCCCIEHPALTLRYCYICSTERELETEGNSARPSGSRSQPLRTGRDAPAIRPASLPQRSPSRRPSSPQLEVLQGPAWCLADDKHPT